MDTELVGEALVEVEPVVPASVGDVGVVVPLFVGAVAEVLLTDDGVLAVPLVVTEPLVGGETPVGEEPLLEEWHPLHWAFPDVAP